jgi:hypothetical protein
VSKEVKMNIRNRGTYCDLQSTLQCLQRFKWVIFFACLTSAGGAWSQTPLDCNRLLGSSQYGELFSIDVSDASTEFIGQMPAGLATEIEFDIGTDTVYAEGTDGNTALYQIDPTTGDPLGVTYHLYGALNGMEFVDSKLYATFIDFSQEPSTLVTVDTTTGHLAAVGLTGFGPISGLAFNTKTGIMYGVTAGGMPADLVTINLQTGAGTVVGPTGLNRIGSIEFGPDGKLYGGLTSRADVLANHLVQIDLATGEAIPVGDTGFSITGLTSCKAPIVLDHFQCYVVRPDDEGESVEKRTAVVEDQFGIAERKVFMPQLLCNPASKDGSEINDPEAHLVCYQIINRGNGPKDEHIEVAITDQFGELTLEVVEPRLMCLPATKELLTELDDDGEDD